jgi:hypothetical protein
MTVLTARANDSNGGGVRAQQPLAEGAASARRSRSARRRPPLDTVHPIEKRPRTEGSPCGAGRSGCEEGD